MDEFAFDLTTEAGVQSAITGLYVSILGRAPDPDGLDFWAGEFSDGVADGKTPEQTLGDIAESFRANAAEDPGSAFAGNADATAVLNADSGDDVTDAQIGAFVDQWFLNTLGREYDPEGVDSALAGVPTSTIRGALEDENGASIGDALVTLLNVVASGDGDDATTVNNRITAGEDFVAAVEDPDNLPDDFFENAGAALSDTPPADTEAPTVAADQALTFTEGAAEGDVLGTIAASDNTDVTGFAIVDDGQTGGVDAYVDVATDGTVTLNAAGAADEAFNDFETTPNSFDLTVTASDAAGNTSAAQSVTINVENDPADDALNQTVNAENTGPFDATTGDVQFNVESGNFSAEIDGFDSGDVLNGFEGAGVTVQPDEDQADGEQVVTLADSDAGTNAEITFTGLTSDQDSGLFNSGQFDVVFGDGTLVFGQDPAQGGDAGGGDTGGGDTGGGDTGGGDGTDGVQAVATDGASLDAADGDETFEIASGSFAATIENFDAGDVLDPFDGAGVTVQPDQDQADGVQVITFADSDAGTEAEITLTGLTAEQDSGVFNTGSFTNVFGDGALI